jgi:hypothetical protein
MFESETVEKVGYSKVNPTASPSTRDMKAIASSLFIRCSKYPKVF